MMNFLITFEGTGFDLSTEDGQRIGGFFVSVVSSASSPELAFDLAHEKLVNCQAYRGLVSACDHPNGVLSVREYSEIAGDDLQTDEVSGFVFYPPDDEAEAGNSTDH